jgi:tetratricopeptide (TPR) repeat protein
MSRTFMLFFAIFGLCVTVSAQVAPESHLLVPGQPVERQIAGGQSHTYQITLQAGQFMRVLLEQKAIDAALVLAAPDGKQVVEVNLTAVGGLESLSAEAAASGNYRLTVRAASSATLAGSYQVRLEVKAAATAQDRQRIAAERWMVEARELRKQPGKTAEQAIDKLQQALSVWRELGDQYCAAQSLYSIGSLTGLGSLYRAQTQYEKAIQLYEQALAVARRYNERDNESLVLYNLALAERGRGNLPMARTHIEESLRVVESMRSDILSPESRASFLANVQSSYQLYIDVLMREHKAEPTKGFAALAVEISERQRARSFLDLLTEAHADLRQGVDPTLIERERTAWANNLTTRRSA